ncbi:MAG: FadR/GntR family transcriptional regulator [Hyphomicrobiaceae bacterium]
MSRQTKRNTGLRDEVYESMFSQILDGTLKAGSQLPTEHALAKQYKVARSTLRRALERLKRDRLIIARQGDGHYVAGIGNAEPRAIQLGGQADSNEIFEVRRLLEGQAAASAAVTCDSSAMKAVEQVHASFVEEVQEDEINIINLRRLDIEFHLAIADCGSNSLLKEMIGFFAPGLAPFWLAWMRLGQDQQRLLAKDVLKQHSLIVWAIRAGDPNVAELAMRSHFQPIQERNRRLFGRDLLLE